MRIYTPYAMSCMRIERELAWIDFFKEGEYTRTPINFPKKRASPRSLNPNLFGPAESKNIRFAPF